MTRVFAAVPAAGRGSRLARTQPTPAHDRPKQHWPVGIQGESILELSLQALLRDTRIECIMVALSLPDPCFAASALAAHARIRCCPGGAQRADSVRQALQTLLQDTSACEEDLVLVHDAARPLLAPAPLAALIDTALAYPAQGALLAVPAYDTIKRANLAEHPHRVAQTLARATIWQAQTPQCFRLGALLHALQQADSQVTDEASAMEQQGIAPILVEGSRLNFKITDSADLALATALLQSRQVP